MIITKEPGIMVDIAPSPIQAGIIRVITIKTFSLILRGKLFERPAGVREPIIAITPALGPKK